MPKIRRRVGDYSITMKLIQKAIVKLSSVICLLTISFTQVNYKTNEKKPFDSVTVNLTTHKIS